MDLFDDLDLLLTPAAFSRPALLVMLRSSGMGLVRSLLRWLCCSTWLPVPWGAAGPRCPLMPECYGTHTRIPDHFYQPRPTVHLDQHLVSYRAWFFLPKYTLPFKEQDPDGSEKGKGAIHLYQRG